MDGESVNPHYNFFAILSFGGLKKDRLGFEVAGCDGAVSALRQRRADAGVNAFFGPGASAADQVVKAYVFWVYLGVDSAGAIP